MSGPVSDVTQKLNQLKTDLEVLRNLPQGQSGSSSQNQKVQESAQKCFEAIKWADLDENQIDILKDVAESYNGIVDKGGFKRLWGFGTSTTETILRKGFLESKKLIDARHGIDSHQNKAYPKITIDPTRPRIAVELVPAVSTISEMVGEAVENIFPKITCSEMPWKAMGSRIFARVMHGTMHEHYAAKVTALSAKFKALMYEIKTMNNSEDKSSLSNLMKRAIDIQKELQQLQDSDYWRLQDIVNNYKGLSDIQEGLAQIGAICVNTLKEAIQANPRSYKQSCSTLGPSRLKFNERVKQLCNLSAVDLSNDAIRMFKEECKGVHDEFISLLDALATDSIWSKEMRDSLQGCVSQYSIGRKSPAVFKIKVMALASERLEGLLVGTDEANRSAEALFGSLESKLEAGICQVGAIPDEAFSDLIKEIIIESTHEVILAKTREMSVKYLALQGVLREINPSLITSEASLYGISEKELNDLIAIAGLFSVPDAATEREETISTRYAKITSALTTLQAMRDKLDSNIGITGILDSLIEKGTQYQTLLLNTEELEAVNNRKITQEVRRRHQAIIHLFCNVVREGLYVQEERDFQSELQPLGINLYVPPDVFAWAVLPSSEEIPERGFWDEWLERQKLSPGIDLINLKRLTPEAAVDVLANGNSARKDELMAEFNKELAREFKPFDLIHSSLRRGEGREDIEFTLQAPPFNYTQEKAQNLVGICVQLREKSRQKIQDAKDFLTSEFQKKSSEEPRDLQDWQIQKYLTASGFTLSPSQMKSILDLNVSKRALEDVLDVASTRLDLSQYIYPEKKWKALQRSQDRNEERINAAGKEIMKLRSDFPKGKMAIPISREVKRELKGWIERTGNTLGSIIPLKKSELIDEYDHCIIDSFLQISRLRMHFNDAEWNDFCLEIDFEKLHGRVAQCGYDREEVYEICRGNEERVSEAKLAYETLLDKLALGESVDLGEIKNITQKYSRALKVFETEVALIRKYLVGETPEDKLKRYKKFSSIAEMREKVDRLYPNGFDDLKETAGSLKRVYGLFNLRLISKTEELTPKLEIRVYEQKALEDVVKIAQSKGALHKLSKLETQIRASSNETSLADKIILQGEYVALLREAISKQEGLEGQTASVYALQEFEEDRPGISENFMKEYPDLCLENLRIKLKSAEAALRKLTRPDPELPSKMQQNVILGIRQRALEIVSQREGLRSFLEVEEAKNQYVLSTLSRPSAEFEEGKVLHLEKMKANEAGWRDLPEFEQWKEWANTEYAQLSLVSPGSLPNLEERSMLDILTFLSEASGKDPELYNKVLFERFTSFVLTQGLLPPRDVTLTQVSAVTQEIDSVFFGAEWQKWVHDRCTSSSAPSEGAQEAKWKAGGVQCLQEVIDFRTDKANEQLRREFIEKQIIPAFARYGVTLSVEAATQLLRSMQELQRELPVDIVAPVSRLPTLFDNRPDLVSVLSGTEWQNWVHDRCKSRSAPSEGAQEAKWKAGGVQCLQEVIDFRTDKADEQLQEEFIAEKLKPCLQKYDLDEFNPEDVIVTMIAYQQQSALMSIKGKIQGYCNSADDVPLLVLQRAVARYFQALGLKHFDEPQALQFLLQMKEYTKVARQKALQKTSPESIGQIECLATVEGFNEEAARALGFTEPQIAVFSRCYMSHAVAEESLREAVAVGSWEITANRICQERLKDLDRALRPQVYL